MFKMPLILSQEWIFLWIGVFNCFILVCLLQVLCRHHRQYQHHQVCPLHLGNWVLQLVFSCLAVLQNVFILHLFALVFDLFPLSTMYGRILYINVSILDSFRVSLNNHFSFLLVCQLQVLCRHHLQYQHHQVYPPRQGNYK